MPQMKGSDTLQFYIARAEQERQEGDAATLAHVRDRCRRSEAAWSELAERAQRGERTRIAEASRVAARRADEMAQRETPSQEPMPGEQETPNPAPDKDYSDKEQPFTEGEETDPEIDDE
jgi:hypothetical protein